MGAFFCAILALDIVYDALSLEDIKKCEALISERISRVNRSGSWKTARYGTHGTWEIYKGDRTEQDDSYYALINQITPDGVSPVTNTYAGQGLAVIVGFPSRVIWMCLSLPE